MRPGNRRRVARGLLVAAIVTAILVAGIAWEWHAGSHCMRIYHCYGGPLSP